MLNSSEAMVSLGKQPLKKSWAHWTVVASDLPKGFQLLWDLKVGGDYLDPRVRDQHTKRLKHSMQ